MIFAVLDISLIIGLNIYRWIVCEHDVDWEEQTPLKHLSVIF